MYPLENDELATAIGQALLAQGAKVAVAESTAGGLISARLLSVAGASAWFERGMIVYSGTARRDLLGVDLEWMREHGSVSEAAVADMAAKLRDSSGVAYALAESGVAGPQTGRRSVKEVGAVVISVASPAGIHTEEHLLPGTRAEVMQNIAQRSLEMLRDALTG